MLPSSATFRAWLMRWSWGIVFLVTIMVVVFAGVLGLQPPMTRWIQGDSFRAGLNRSTSKGLHLQGQYEPIRRTGFWSVATDGFSGTEGFKAMKRLIAHDVTATFNPWGIFLRRWQLENVHIHSGEIEIQIYEPKPEIPSSKPWYTIFLPDRVYLKEVLCDVTQVTWRLRDQEAGFYDTRLVITPYGRDFEYYATGGTMKMALIPEQQLRDLHLRVTKELLTLYGLNLLPEKSGPGLIHVEGKAGLKEDKSVDAAMTFDQVPIAPWIPTTWGGEITGQGTGNIRWQGSNPKVESSSGSGELRIDGGKLQNLRLLHFLAAATRQKSLETLDLTQCALTFAWKYPQAEIKNIVLEAAGVFRVEGALEIKNGVLGGEVQLGVADAYLDWLPRSRDDIFTREQDGLRWTTVHFSGTLRQPQNDLTPRLQKTLEKSPSDSAGLFFRMVGEWFEQSFSK